MQKHLLPTSASIKRKAVTCLNKDQKNHNLAGLNSVIHIQASSHNSSSCKNYSLHQQLDKVQNLKLDTDKTMVLYCVSILFMCTPTAEAVMTMRKQLPQDSTLCDRVSFTLQVPYWTSASPPLISSAMIVRFTPGLTQTLYRLCTRGVAGQSL